MNNILSFTLIGSVLSFGPNKEGYHVTIESDGSNNITIQGEDYTLDKDKALLLLEKISVNYPLFKKMSENQTGEGLLGGMMKTLIVKTNDDDLKISYRILTHEYMDKFDEFEDNLFNDIKNI